MKFIKSFSEIDINDIALVGGKNASLGEMYSALAHSGVKVPDGFAITADAYRLFIHGNKLQDRIANALENLDTHNFRALAETGRSIRGWIMHSSLPKELAKEISLAYRDLSEKYGQHTDVAVRSSATAEDLPNASFAGQQETYLNIHGIENLIVSCKRVFASLFTDRAISYRVDKGFNHMDVALSIGVQKMVRADLGVSGVMFTLDTESGFRDVTLITAAYGLGENVVQGSVNPDEYYVYKPMLKDSLRPIVRKHLGEKAIKMVYTYDGAAGISTRNIQVAREQRHEFALNDDDILQLARYGNIIEQHYSEQAGHEKPMDIEWAKDGISGDLYILQARPETVLSTAGKKQQQEVFRMQSRGEIITTGKSVGQRIAAGQARVILEPEHMRELKPGEILVTDITDPDWEPVMKIAGAIVTNRGGRTCHAAIVARELGIPAIVGTGNATQEIKTGEEVTVSCAESDTGFVYRGLQKFEVELIDIENPPQPKTHVMLNLANPDQAFKYSTLPVDGVGLARLEFIINHNIRIHPKALLQLDQLEETKQAEIRSLIHGYDSPETYYISQLAQGIAMIAAAFFPRPVIVRLSDFKSNEYASLIGGTGFEPKEENPMIGLRGASRYYSELFADCFRLECEAIKQVRETMGLTNVAIMLPFVRSIQEASAVLDIMQDQGLKRGEKDLQIFLMCEIPTNALLAEQFLELFDGFSIGSNDLTQLTLGADRDSGLITNFDERDPAVLKLIELAIDACKQKDKYVGICGQAPSDYPEFTRWLVSHGINSISLNPDSVIAMSRVIAEMENTGNA